jgi:hypothetical protein
LPFAHPPAPDFRQAVYQAAQPGQYPAPGQHFGQHFGQHYGQNYGPNYGGHPYAQQPPEGYPAGHPHHTQRWEHRSNASAYRAPSNRV